MRGNMDGSIERDDDLADQQYDRDCAERTADDLVVLARLALMDRVGHPVTHICGRPIEDVLRMAEAYAKGMNFGSNLWQRYPWG
jgi:hypothetical protein